MSAHIDFLLIALGILLLQFVVFYSMQRVERKLRRVDSDISKRSDTIFRQMEALAGIYVELDLHKSLPTTRNWAASPDFLLQLVRHVLDANPKVMVECGSGTSTLVMARCAQVNGSGHVYSLEHQPQYAQTTRRHLARHGLSNWATVLDAPLRPHPIGGENWQWYPEEVLPREVAIDMLVIDGPPRKTGPLARYPAGPVLFPHLSSKGTVFLDDAKRDGESATLKRWVVEFPNLGHESVDCEKGCARLWII